MKPLTPEKMRRLDEVAINRFGIPGIVLMENAGRGAAEIIKKGLPSHRKETDPKVLIVCGSGNNGGDGFVVARHLANQKLKVRVIFLGQPAKLSPDARVNYKIIQKMKVLILRPSALEIELRRASIVVDGVFGTGLSRSVEGEAAFTIQSINESKKPVIALDIPSGLNGKTGKVMGVAIKARKTIAFGAAKTGFYKADGPGLTGKIFVVDISIPYVLLN